MKVLLYCTKNAPYLLDLRRVYEEVKFDTFKSKEKLTNFNVLNGKIVAECDYEIEEIRMLEDCNMTFLTQTLSEEELLKKSCLEGYELGNYLGDNAFRHINGKAIHIKNLHIFNDPRKLNEYCNLKCSKCGSIKAPQNMMYVYKDNIKYVLISIHPEHLCKILNGEKTIEVRKKVLKCM